MKNTVGIVSTEDARCWAGIRKGFSKAVASHLNPPGGAGFNLVNLGGKITVGWRRFCNCLPEARECMPGVLRVRLGYTKD